MMSRAFTREDDNENAIADIGERPVSPHRNLVTAAGLAQIEEEIAGAVRQGARRDGRGQRQGVGDCKDEGEMKATRPVNLAPQCGL